MTSDTRQQNNEKVTLTRGLVKTFITLFKERPLLFIVVWVLLFGGLLSISFAFDIIPRIGGDPASGEVAGDATTTAPAVSEEAMIPSNSAPARIIIDRIGVNAPVNNPESRNIEVLNESLLTGVVHYPGSGDLEDTSNLFLFGHSSGLRVVHNQLFKVFNGLKELKKNDIIKVQSESKEYLYRVKSVTLTTADQAFVELSNRKKTLTLSTCNTFGAKEERYVVQADFVGSYDL